MNPDEFQKVWRSQDAAPQVRIDADLLLREVRRNQRSFQGVIFWRDFREIGVAGVLCVLFAVGGFVYGGWAQWLLALAMLWVAGFLLFDRWRQSKRAAQFRQSPSLIASVEASLQEVNHQIWLLKNVAWWYLLPPFVGLLVVFASSAGIVDGAMWGNWIRFLVPSTACLLLFAGIYWINQYAVRTQLLPRQRELLALRDSLRETDE